MALGDRGTVQGDALRPFVVKAGLAAEDTYHALCQQLLVDIRLPDFCAVTYPLTVWGKRPASI